MNTQLPQTNQYPQAAFDTPIMRRKDPILEEVYSVKAKLNAEANYSVEKILERSRSTTTSFNLR